jgi:hypothetical protein
MHQPNIEISSSYQARVNYYFEKTQSRTNSVSLERKRCGCRKKTVHHVVRVRCKAYEKEEFGTFLDGAYNAFDCDGAGEPPGDEIAKKCAGKNKYSQCTAEGCTVGNYSASPRAKRVAGQYNKCLEW